MIDHPVGRLSPDLTANTTDGDIIGLCSSVTDLSVLLVQELPLHHHADCSMKSYKSEQRSIASARRLMEAHATNPALLSLVTSWPDSCNALMVDGPLKASR